MADTMRNSSHAEFRHILVGHDRNRDFRSQEVKNFYFNSLIKGRIYIYIMKSCDININSCTILINVSKSSFSNGLLSVVHRFLPRFHLQQRI